MLLFAGKIEENKNNKVLSFWFNNYLCCMVIGLAKSNYKQEHILLRKFDNFNEFFPPRWHFKHVVLVKLVIYMTNLPCWHQSLWVYFKYIFWHQQTYRLLDLAHILVKMPILLRTLNNPCWSYKDPWKFHKDPWDFLKGFGGHFRSFRVLKENLGSYGIPLDPKGYLRGIWGSFRIIDMKMIV